MHSVIGALQQSLPALKVFFSPCRPHSREWKWKCWEYGGVFVYDTVFLVTALVYRQQLLLWNMRDFPSEATNLFLHAGAGDDTTLFPQTGGDDLGHAGRVGGVFNLRWHMQRTFHATLTRKCSRLVITGLLVEPRLLREIEEIKQKNVAPPDCDNCKRDNNWLVGGT